MVLLQVPFAAVMLCGHGHDRGRGGGCSRNIVTAVIGAEISGDTLFSFYRQRFDKGTWFCFKYLLRLSCCVVMVMTVVAVVVVVATMASIFGSGGGCHCHRHRWR